MTHALYAPAYKTKKAPGTTPGKIAWEDGTRKAFYLRYNGTAWEVRPIDGIGRIEPGFKYEEPVATLPTEKAAWYYVASSGAQAYTPPPPVKLDAKGKSVLSQMKKYPKASRDAARAIIGAINLNGDGEYAFETIGPGTPQECTRFRANRTLGDLTVYITQWYAEEDGKIIKKRPPTVNAARTVDGKETVLIYDHKLTGEKHMSWFFTNDTDAVKTWVDTAVTRIKKHTATS